MDSEGATLSWSHIGLALTIPPGAVPKGKEFNLCIRPCLSGPFVLPDGYQMSSPAYLISPAAEFQKDVEVVVDHFMKLTSKEDCDEMKFISAPCKPHDDCGPKYKFRFLKGGVFGIGNIKASIKLNHFCIVSVAATTKSMFLTRI